MGELNNSTNAGIKGFEEESILINVSAKLKGVAGLFQREDGKEVIHLLPAVHEGISMLLWDMAHELDSVVVKWGEEAELRKPLSARTRGEKKRKGR